MIKNIYKQIEQDICNFQPNELSEFSVNPNQNEPGTMELVEKATVNFDKSIKERIFLEFFSWGPVEPLLNDPEITEIIINGPESIWYEKEGRLFQIHDSFSSEFSYKRFLDRVCMEAGKHHSLENPFCDGTIRNFRLHFCAQVVSPKNSVLTLRRQSEFQWTFEKLKSLNWASEKELDFLKNLILNRDNILIVGPTGAGKTSVMNALINSIPTNERCVVIEETTELKLPNSCSVALLARKDANGLLPNIDQSDLVRHSLRMRPDRLIIGEVRGTEAKDLLLALSTGHAGSMGTLHASSAQQALLRLEMLIQMGAPQWSLHTVRNLISMSLNYIVVTGKTQTGQRKLLGIEKISSLEETGFLLERV